jgi:glycosyltransferase involved in cell wall biosynthesis
MLLGLAPRMRDELGVPVLCSVQGEDIFLDELSEPYRSRVRDALREQAHHVDRFIATSDYYRDYMTGFLEVPSHKMSLVELGLNLDGHGTLARKPDEPPFVVGYLARICPEKGLHELAESFRRLAARAGAERVRLRIAGYLGERDRAYFDGILAQVREWGLEQAVEYVGEVDRQAKIDFLNSIHVLSVPTTYREPKGLFVLEALANGVPVVQPRHGAFPEMIESLGGGLLVEPGSTDELTEALASLMGEPARREELGRQGRAAVHATRGDDQMARATLEIYRQHLRSSGTGSQGRAVG